MFLGKNKKLDKGESNENQENNIDNECEEDIKITSDWRKFTFCISGKKVLSLNMGMSYPYYMLLTKQQDMHYHCFILWLKLV